MRGVEAMDNNYHLLDLTVYGRRETWEDSPHGWPLQCTYTGTRSGWPTWKPVWLGGRPHRPVVPPGGRRSDDLGTGRR
jgi:Bacterial protein of unknown function (DUF899)